MDEMTAFDRQIASEVLRVAGPSQPVDDLAVFESIAAANRQKRWGFDMFSALKFVAASVIVALFGGFLLAGVLTTQQGDEVAPAAVTESPSPMTSERLLSRMVTEEVEPGVFRVVHDGVRDLASGSNADIVAGDDGSIWLLRDDAILRLGSEGSHEWPMDSGPEDFVFEVTLDGAMWVIPRWVPTPWLQRFPDLRDGGGLRSTDGEEWTAQPCPTGEDCRGMVVAPDGSGWRLPDESRLWMRLFFTGVGDAYGVWCYGDCYLVPYENGADLARFAEEGTDDEPAPLTAADLPDIRYGFGLDHPFEIAPDGSLWSSLWRSPNGGDPREGDASIAENLLTAVEDGRLVCDGLARFDGDTLDHYLPGRCITMDVARDGSVWVLTDEDEGKVLYVITPEAVAVKE